MGEQKRPSFKFMNKHEKRGKKMQGETEDLEGGASE